MKKLLIKLFTVILLLATGSSLYCQVISPGLDLSKAKGYNNHIFSAELDISDSLYQQAVDHYDSAGFFHPLFSNDRYNKAVCEALTANYNDCHNDLKYLLEKGLMISIVAENTAFSKFLESKEGRDLLSTKIGVKYNASLRKVYDSLYREDQYLRSKMPYGEEIRKVDSSNVIWMKSLIEVYGWPTDELIGVHVSGEKPYTALINHQRNPQYRIVDFTNDLYAAYANGNIEAHEAAELIALMEQSDKFKINDAGIVTVLLDSTGVYTGQDPEMFEHVTGFLKFREERLNMFNANRLMFGLETIEDFRRKLLYFRNDKRFMISGKGWYASYGFRSLEDYKIAVRNLVPIE